MKKYIYAITTALIMTLGSYTVYGEFINSHNAKSNLSTMNKKHLFASVIDTTDNGEIYNNKQPKKYTSPASSNPRISKDTKPKKNVIVSSKKNKEKNNSKTITKKVSTKKIVAGKKK